MSCTLCDYFNSEIMRKAKETADALIALIKPDAELLKSDGTTTD